MKSLESNAINGRQIIFVKEEELMSDTNTTLCDVFKALGWEWPGDLSEHVQVYCQFQKKTMETDNKVRILPLDVEKMALIQLMQSFNLKTYTFDQHSLMTANPTEQSKKDI